MTDRNFSVRIRWHDDETLDYIYYMTTHYLDINYTYPVKCDIIFPVASLRPFSGTNNSVGRVCTSLV